MREERTGSVSRNAVRYWYEVTSEAVRRQVEFRDEPFKLRSGRLSHVYCDTRPALLTPEVGAAIGHLFQQLICAHSPIDVIGGGGFGGALLAPAVNTSAQFIFHSRQYPLFLTRPAKDHGKMDDIHVMPDGALIAVHTTAGLELDGKKMAIVEDVITSGSSVQVTGCAARARGAELKLVLSIVDRNESEADQVHFLTNGADGGVLSVPYFPLFQLSEKTRSLSTVGRTLELLMANAI